MNVNGQPMVIDAPEYIHAVLNDMRALRGMIQGNPFVKDYSQILLSVNQRIQFYESLIKDMHCKNCLHFSRNTGMECGAVCRVNGFFPDHINPDTHFCGAWIFDDVPF